MRIYTKTGDTGLTGLYKSPRVGKNHPRIQAIGEVDELNCQIGVCLCTAIGWPSELLNEVQRTLMRVGGDLASPGDELVIGGKNSSFCRIHAGDIQWLEDQIDEMDNSLPALTTFILPGGCRSGAALHMARAICRRAERQVAELHFGDFPFNQHDLDLSQPAVRLLLHAGPPCQRQLRRAGAAMGSPGGRGLTWQWHTETREEASSTVAVQRVQPSG
jgi:cob(I)alamin adenosyltransferase